MQKAQAESVRLWYAYRMTTDPDTLRTEMGANLRRLRERMRPRVSQAALARALGWHRPTITIIEGGKQGVPAHDLPAYAAALRCPVVRLLPVGWRK